MSRHLMLVTVVGVAACLLFGPQRSWAIEFNERELARLEAGKTVRKPLANSSHNGFYAGTGFVIVDAAPEVVWEAILDWSSYHKVFPKTVGVKEIARKGKSSLLRMELGHRFLSITYHLNVVRDPAKKLIKYNLATNRPHDIEHTQGYWRLFPQQNGRTLVAYAVAVQVPMGVVNLLGSDLAAKIERHLLGSPGALKKWVEGPNGSKYHRMTAQR